MLAKCLLIFSVVYVTPFLSELCFVSPTQPNDNVIRKLKYRANWFQFFKVLMDSPLQRKHHRNLIILSPAPIWDLTRNHHLLLEIFIIKEQKFLIMRQENGLKWTITHIPKGICKWNEQSKDFKLIKPEYPNKFWRFLILYICSVWMKANWTKFDIWFINPHTDRKLEFI